MGFSRRRAGQDGRPRYTAYYRDLKDRECSAGTFSNKKDADRAWQRAEAKVAEGRLGDPGRGRQTFQAYVEQIWLPSHQIEATTRQSYTYSVYKHLMPEFGPMRMVDILPEHVRAWVARLRDAGVTPVTIRYNKVLLSAIFTTALNDQVVFLHPCRGVKVPTVPQKPRAIITPEQFCRVYDALPDDTMRLLAETKIETGLRWGELTELRVKDIDFPTRMLTVTRAVVEVNAKFHPAGGRFLVKDYNKDGEYRRLKLTSQIAGKLRAYVGERELSDDNLVFAMPQRGPMLKVLPNPDQLGRTEPTPLVVPTGTGRSVPTRPDAAGATIVGVPSPSTVHIGGRLARMIRVCHASGTPMATSRATGFGIRSGSQRSRRPPCQRYVRTT